MAAARATGHAAARVHPRRDDQDPDPVPSRLRPGAAAISHPRHQCGPAPVAARAPERNPGRAPSFGVIAGCGCHASGLGRVAGGPDDALHLAARLASAAAVAGVGQSHWPQDAGLGAVAVRAWASCRSTRPWAAAGSTWRSRSSACSSAARSTVSIRTAPQRSGVGLSRRRAPGMSSRRRLCGTANAGSGGDDPVATKPIGSAALGHARTDRFVETGQPEHQNARSHGRRPTRTSSTPTCYPLCRAERANRMFVGCSVGLSRKAAER